MTSSNILLFLRIALQRIEALMKTSWFICWLMLVGNRNHMTSLRLHVVETLQPPCELDFVYEKGSALLNHRLLIWRTIKGDSPLSSSNSPLTTAQWMQLDPNYYCDGAMEKNRLIYAQRKCLTRQLKSYVAARRKVHCTIFNFPSNITFRLLASAENGIVEPP